MPQVDDFYSRTSCEVRLCKDIPFNNNYDFYSRTSCEVRLGDEINNSLYRSEFLLTHLMRGATNNCKTVFQHQWKFLLTHLMRGATWLSLSYHRLYKFLLTHLMRGATAIFSVFSCGAPIYRGGLSCFFDFCLILSFLEGFFQANLLGVRHISRVRLNYDHSLRIIGFFSTDVLDTPLPVITEIIKS